MICFFMGSSVGHSNINTTKYSQTSGYVRGELNHFLLTDVQVIMTLQLIPINNFVLFYIKVTCNRTLVKIPVTDLPLSENGSLVQKLGTQCYSNCCELLNSHTVMPWPHPAPRLRQIDLWAISAEQY